MISRELLRYLEVGYQEFYHADLNPKQIQEYMIGFAKDLHEKERLNIIRAFLAGWNYRGQCDHPQILASLYWDITHGDYKK
jgi:hypothetical protein